ncbi:hypothetical protein [Nitrobacter sp. JJSN]|uniref:hypothetical protein n=1 Tax=Nitrobacter sp. JJSN TaxID=3453033 RepID=UPI003F7759E2
MASAANASVFRSGTRRRPDRHHACYRHRQLHRMMYLSSVFSFAETGIDHPWLKAFAHCEQLTPSWQPGPEYRGNEYLRMKTDAPPDIQSADIKVEEEKLDDAFRR